MKLIRNKYLYIGKSEIEGYGVFTNKDIVKGELIQEAPWLAIPYKSQLSPIRDVTFKLYRDDSMAELDLPENQNIRHQSALTLGYGSMFNTALGWEDATADWRIVVSKRCLEFYAIKNIPAGQEILTFYGNETNITCFIQVFVILHNSKMQS